MIPNSSRPQTLNPLDTVKALAPDARPTGTVVGIDLGSSAVRVAVVRRGVPEVLTSARRRFIPALLAVSPDKRLVVGRDAQNLRLVEGTESLVGARWLLGAPDEAALQLARDHSSADIDPVPNAVRVRFGYKPYLASDLVAMLLVEARNWAQEVLHVPVQRAVITVPPGRTQPAVEGLRAAALRAGMALERPVTTVAAAILATLRGSKDTQDRLVLVWDWGASGLELTLTSASPNQVTVKATAAYRDLTGFEVDANLLREVINTWPEEAERLGREPVLARARLAAALELAKLQLVEREEVRVHLPLLFGAENPPGSFDHAVPRDALYRAMAPLVRRAFEACQQFLAAQGLTPADVAEVVFCGGQCEVSALEPRFRAFFPNVQLHLQAPSERAVLGAALAAQRAELGMTAAR